MTTKRAINENFFLYMVLGCIPMYVMSVVVVVLPGWIVIGIFATAVLFALGNAVYWTKPHPVRKAK